MIDGEFMTPNINTIKRSSGELRNINPIINFYLDDKNLKKTLGFTHEDFINSSDDWLETCHGHIQWAFPLEVGSAYIKDAPLLTPDVIKLFQGSEHLQNKLNQSFSRMTQFYGMGTSLRDYDNWITPRNHNFLRLTRMIRSLGMLEDSDYYSGIYSKGDMLHKRLKIICNAPKYRAIIGDETINYWNESYVESLNQRNESNIGTDSKV